MVVHAPAASNGNLELPYGYSLLAYKAKDFPDPAAIDLDDKLRKMTVIEALVRVSPTFFENTHSMPRLRCTPCPMPPI